MAKVKVEVTGAYVDGHAPGSEITIEEESANHLEDLGYVERKGSKSKSSNDDSNKNDNS